MSIDVFFMICIVIHIQKTFSNLPSYVHLHTSAEIMETNYVVLHKMNLCQDSQYANSQLFIAIKSAANNLAQRQLIRQTWLSDVIEHEIPYVFVLGSTNNEELLERILEEDKKYHDLIIGKIVDDYYNLTLKSIFTVTWTKVYCPTRWLLYVDDDTIINVQNIIRFITSVKDLSDLNLFCDKCPRQVHREFGSKWYIPKSIWSDGEFPEFCYGWGYLIPSNTLPLLQKISTDITTKPKLWLEDVFVTGIATKAAGIKVIQSAFVCCQLRDSGLFKKNMVLGEMGNNKEFLRSWKIVRGKSIFSQKRKPKYSYIKNTFSSFDRKGLLMRTSIETNDKLLNFLQGITYMNSFNRSYLLYSILVIVIVILLYIGLSQQILLRLIEKVFYSQ